MEEYWDEEDLETVISEIKEDFPEGCEIELEVFDDTDTENEEEMRDFINEYIFDKDDSLNDYSYEIIG